MYSKGEVILNIILNLKFNIEIRLDSLQEWNFTVHKYVEYS